MKNLLFLCTGNSCRSQIAEGFGKQLLADKFVVYSAGTNPQGVNPRAVETMAEIGIDISSQTSDALDIKLLNQMDLVITLCGDAAETCPLTPPSIEKRHWDIPDPARFQGTPEEARQHFREVRDDIRRRIEELAAQ